MLTTSPPSEEVVQAHTTSTDRGGEDKLAFQGECRCGANKQNSMLEQAAAGTCAIIGS